MFPVSTYIRDRVLFSELGLAPFKDVPSQTTLEIGRESVGDDGSYVDIAVTCMPAQFWRFRIYRASSKRDANAQHGERRLLAGSQALRRRNADRRSRTLSYVGPARSSEGDGCHSAASTGLSRLRGSGGSQ
jgi:hypothetical protein